VAQLRDLGCDYGQGFWFAHDLDASGARDLIDRFAH
jgi:EAL domain-containing protein (putative c-di-GMP-specific phosphodiesterase class I)